MVVPDINLHSDGVLQLAAFRIAQRFGEPNPAAKSEYLPLERAVVGNSSVWKASQILVEYEGERFWDHYTRRWEMNRWSDDHIRERWDMRVQRDTIEQGTGHQKSFLFVQPVRMARRAVSWCVGDEAAVRQMLQEEIFALGKNVRMGWGRIREIVVSPAPAEEAENWRRRTLPIEMEAFKLDGHFRAVAGIKAPYWDRSNWKEAWQFDETRTLTPA